ncbi:MAG TPA: aminoglycoside phosphotransferase family protein [Pseudonocardiaceae bacterium]|nr:aminoglycoside phosphotransferase family protein [Pseudonocardiaceae bacterium]
MEAEPAAGRPVDVPLTGGRMTDGIIRRGDQVRRPTGPWSPAVHEYLRHLAGVGFTGAPRLLGVESDREVLSYLDGVVADDPQWQPGRGHRLPRAVRTESALVSVAALIRGLHDAARGFRPTEVGYRFHPHPPLVDEVVSHGDLGPWNTVYRDGVAVGFIDWDAARPVDPVVDLAGAAWAFVPLAPAKQLREAGFGPLPDLGRRLRLFLDAYGLTDRLAILPALWRSRLASVEHVRYWPVDAAGAADVLEFTAGQLRWLQDNQAELTRQL